MPGHQQTNINKFFVAGINYKKTNVTLRGQFAINSIQYAKLLTLAPIHNVNELFVISTCNRTEIYGFAENVADLCQLICTQTQGSVETFNKIAYIKNDKEAIRHLFDVATGLDSQILGDYEIVGQLKQAVKFSRQHNFIGPYLDRLVNAALQSSKLIKTNTGLSNGTVSVSFAAMQYIKEKAAGAAGKKILLIGTGKIGRITCKNLVDYLKTKDITLINRTPHKAAALANELGLHQYADIKDLPKHIAKADIILVATNAANPVILQSHLLNKGNKIVIDLSIPCNVEKHVQDLQNITLVNVDDLSKIKDATLQKREAEIPKAAAIINEQIFEFLEWHDMRKHAPLLKAVKNKLYAMHNCQLYASYFAKQNILPVTKTNTDSKIQKIINAMAVKIRNQNQQGCSYINAINEFIATSTN